MNVCLLSLLAINRLECRPLLFREMGKTDGKGVTLVQNLSSQAGGSAWDPSVRPATPVAL